MKLILKLLLPALFLGLLLLIAGNLTAEESGKSTVSSLYSCACGGNCCSTIATKPGNCACGKALAPGHVLKIEGNEALLCTCGNGCSCKLDAADASKCGCGKAVKRVNLKGMYACGCGPECSCNTVSDQPGTCACGKALRKIE